MRAPSLFTQCLPGVVHHDRVAHSMSIVSDKDMHLPSPAIEILPSKMGYPYRYAGDSIDWQGVNLFKGRVSVSDIIGSELISSKPDASPKCWDSSLDLVNILKHEIRDGQLSFRGKRVLQLSCGYGIPGIFACLKGASTVHFQDLNAEAVRCKTVPNVLANLEQARERQSRQPESPVTPSRQAISPVVHFYAGEWEELSGVLSLVKNDVLEASPRMNLSFSEEDFLDSRSSHDGSVTGQDTPSRKLRRLSGSRVWESSNDSNIGGGYDVILMTDIPHSATSLKKLNGLIKKCLKPPYGVLFVATKKHFIGFNSAARQLRNLVDDEGVFEARLVKEISDTEIWKFSLK
uniref:histidine protein methyltransferase 1 homolog n=1 Tax=Erigeron canadensis TaxID=72917 RepID=UPI001CB985F8|nr:histidine protein methyltransferase 1 homolog [Erigeron canadensis]